MKIASTAVSHRHHEKIRTRGCRSGRKLRPYASSLYPRTKSAELNIGSGYGLGLRGQAARSRPVYIMETNRRFEPASRDWRGDSSEGVAKFSTILFSVKLWELSWLSVDDLLGLSAVSLVKPFVGQSGSFLSSCSCPPLGIIGFQQAEKGIQLNILDILAVLKVLFDFYRGPKSRELMTISIENKFHHINIIKDKSALLDEAGTRLKPLDKTEYAV